VQTIETSDGRRLRVREAGDPSGVPVLFLNGTPGSSLMYEPHVRDAEEKGIRLVSWDRPGYGGSTRYEGRSVADDAANATAVCDALGIDRFCVWGISGGGPHALALAALLPDRCAAAAALAPIAPYDADGLDFTEGMGEQNIEEIGAIFEGEERHLEVLERDRAELMSITPEQLVEAWKSLLGPADIEVTNGSLAAYILDCVRDGVGQSLDGWFDDDIAFVRPWRFDLGSIRVPVLHWQGEQDKFVPFGHGVWLSRRIPDVDSRLSAEDGHLTLAERRIPEVHAWLLERFQPA
jgi:pimeloyl-ACP methyl ester carboxylesterase